MAAGIQFSTLAGGKSLIMVQQGRSAGNTTISILQEEFGLDGLWKLGGEGEGFKGFAEFKQVAPEGRYQIYAGHFCFGAHRWVKGPCDYFTMLRHPIERLLSRYTAWGRTATGQRNFADWIDDNFDGTNGMLKRILGAGIVDDDNAPYDVVNDRPYVGRMEVGEAEYERAVEILEQHFPCVLIQEHFDESMLLLGRTYGMRPLYSLNRQFTNKQLQPTKRENYPPSIVRMIEERNRFDLRLYDTFRKRFLDRIEKEGPAFKEEARIMKLLANIFRHPGSQSLDFAQIFPRVTQFMNDSLKRGTISDAVAVLRRIASKPILSVKFRRFALIFIATHGTSTDIADEIAAYRERFGDDDFVKEIAAKAKVS